MSQAKDTQKVDVSGKPRIARLLAWVFGIVVCLCFSVVLWIVLFDDVETSDGTGSVLSLLNNKLKLKLLPSKVHDCHVYLSNPLSVLLGLPSDYVYCFKVDSDYLSSLGWSNQAAHSPELLVNVISRLPLEYQHYYYSESNVQYFYSNGYHIFYLPHYQQFIACH